MKALALTLLAACAAPGGTRQRAPVTAPPAAPAPADLAAELEPERAARQLPALGAAVWRDGRLVAIGVVGTRRAGDAASRATRDDRWHLGSNTKAMTATLIALHVDRGALAWDDTVAALFAGETIDPGWAAVTIEQLLHHTGGAPAEPPAGLWAALIAAGDAPDAGRALVRAILAQPPAQAPGSHVYSNIGYMIAADALERRTGRGWQKMMREELFAPLGMKRCGFGAPAGRDQPWGHDADGEPVPPGPAADNPPGIGPAGTVHCALADYGKFLALHAGVGPPIVSATSLVRLHRPEGRYAGGWIVLDRPQGVVLGHSGSNTMWFATAVVDPAAKRAVVIVTNRAEPTIEELARPLLKRH